MHTTGNDAPDPLCRREERARLVLKRQYDLKSNENRTVR